MKQTYLGFLAPLIVVLGVVPAAATEPSSVRIDDFICNAELDVLDPTELSATGYTGGLIVSVVGGLNGTTERHCTGSSPDQNVKIRCERLLEDRFSDSWPVGAIINSNGFECRVQRSDCPEDGPEGITTTSQLRIESRGGGDGFLEMQCSLN